MDEIDRDILRRLVNDPQKPFLSIAKEIGISPQTVKKRFNTMKKNNVFFGSSMIIDLSKIGFQGKAFLLTNGSKSYESEIAIKLITQIPNVFLISEIVGPYDLLIMIVFRSATEIQEIVNKIRAIDAIENVDVVLILDTDFPIKRERSIVDLF